MKTTLLGIVALPFWIMGIIFGFCSGFFMDGYVIGGAKYLEIKTGRVGKWLQSNQSQQESH